MPQLHPVFWILLLLLIAFLFWRLGRREGRHEKQSTIADLRKTLSEEVRRADSVSSELCNALRRISGKSEMPTADASVAFTSTLAAPELEKLRKDVGKLEATLARREERVAELEEQLQGQEKTATLKLKELQASILAQREAQPSVPVLAEDQAAELAKLRQGLEGQLGEKDRGLAALSEDKDRLAREIHDLRLRVGELVPQATKAALAESKLELLGKELAARQAQLGEMGEKLIASQQQVEVLAAAKVDEAQWVPREIFSNLEMELAGKQAVNQTAQQRISEMETALSKAHFAEAEAATQIAVLAATKEELTQRTADLRDLAALAETLRIERAEADESMSNLQIAHEQQVIQLATEVKAAGKVDEALWVPREQLANLQMEFATKHEAAALAASRISELEAMTGGTDELEGLKQELSERETELNIAREELRQGEAALAEAAEQTEVYRRERDAYEEEALAQEEQAKQLAAELKAAAKVDEALWVPREQLANLQMEFATKHEAAALAASRISELEAMTGGTDELEGLKHELSERETELNIAREELRQREAALAEAGEQVEIFRRERDAYEEEALAQEEQAKQLAEELKAAGKVDEALWVPREQLANLQMEFATKHEAAALAASRISELEAMTGGSEELESLKQELSERETELNIAREELRQGEAALAEAAEQTEVYRRERDAYEEEALAQEEQAKQLAAELKAAGKVDEALWVPREQLANLQMEFATKHEAAALAASRISELEAMTGGSEELESLKQELSERETELSIAREELRQREAALAEAAEQTEVYRRERDAYEEEALAQEEQAKQLAAELSAAGKVDEALWVPREQLANLQMEFATKHEAAALSASRISELEAMTGGSEELEGLKQELSERETELNIAREELRQRESALAEAAEQTEVFRRERDAYEEEALTQEEQARQLAGELKAAGKVDEALWVPREQLANLQMEFATKHEAAALAASRISELEAMTGDLEELEGLKQELSERETELNIAREELRQREAALAEAGEQVEVFRRERDAYEEEALAQEEQAKQLAAELKAAKVDEDLWVPREQLAGLEVEFMAANEKLSLYEAEANDEAKLDQAVEFESLRGSYERLAKELEKTKQDSLSQEAALAMKGEMAQLQSELKDFQALQGKHSILTDELVNFRRESVPREEYERAKLEIERTRSDLSKSLESISILKKRLDGVANAGSIEKLKAALVQEEKAHGGLRIQYRNLENRIYEAVGARKRVEAEFKDLSKERDGLAAQLKAYMKGTVSKLPAGSVSLEDVAPAKTKGKAKDKGAETVAVDLNFEAIEQRPLEELLEEREAAGLQLAELLGPRGAAHVKKAILKREADTEANPKLTAWELTRSFQQQATVIATAREAGAAWAEQRDDLKVIKGIAEVIEEQLNHAGVYTFHQIVNWTAEEIDAFNDLLAFKGRIQREKWQAQAASLAEAGPSTTGVENAV